MPWTIVFSDGGRELRRLIPDGSSILGSGDEADVRIDHPTVSRRHAMLETCAEGVWVTDQESSNGSRVDGVTLQGRTLVGDGQQLYFGTLATALTATATDEIQAAVEFELEPSESAGVASTLSVGSIRDFVLSALPRVVARLESARRAPKESASSKQAELDLVQSAGAALFDAFPCVEVEISAEIAAEVAHAGTAPKAGRAVLFHAATESAGTSDQSSAAVRSEDHSSTTSGACEEMEVQAGLLITRVRFLPGLHTGALRALAELVTRLASLGMAEIPGQEESSSTARANSATPLPTPETLDPALRKIYADARRIALGDVGVLITGESGTGKELLAKFVHECSDRSGGELVVLNCAALPQDLLEAELFGIEKGVATGVEARPGKFEQAHGGTLFLDEIADMAPATQAKILRVLQEGEVYRLGGQKARSAKVRVIAATNRDLERMVADGAFRLDLFHRIADCRFHLPALRERLVDLPNLAAHFLLRSSAEQGVRVRGLSKAALAAMMQFSWPGNVRQLEREMARAALFLEQGELLQSRHLHDEIAGSPMPGASVAEGSRSLKKRMEATERGFIKEALLRNDGNVRATAEDLEVGRTTLYRRLQELDIEQ